MFEKIHRKRLRRRRIDGEHRLRFFVSWIEQPDDHAHAIIRLFERAQDNAA